MRTLPPELVEQSAQAMFRARQVVTADWDEVCRDSPDIADEVRLLARHTINVVLDHYSKPENVTKEMIDAGWIDREDVDPDDIFCAMVAAIGADDETK